MAEQTNLFGGIDNGSLEFNKRLNQNPNYIKYIQDYEKSFLDEIQILMSHNFRYYQKEALLALDYFLQLPDDDWFKQALLEEVHENRAPFYGFEMATGTGKTLLIGASILYINAVLHLKNFLIILPSTEVYQKTLDNFNQASSKYVYSQKLNKKINVITAENYKDRRSDFLQDADLNIFIFTIQSFFERGKNGAVLNVDKPWESSPWSINGNTVSLRDYLKNEKLIIITDEAHHYQKFRVLRSNKGSLDIIKEFTPLAVLEFTATAVSASVNEARRSQKIIYEYGLRRFIEDGYGKKIRALGYTGSIYVSNGSDVTEDDLKKLLISFMIHLVKRKAMLPLGPNGIKPIVVVRARDTAHADKLWEALKDYQFNDLIIETYKELLSGPKYDITELIRKNVTMEELVEFVKKAPDVSFVYHSNNDTDPNILNKIRTIEKNDQEIIIQVKKLEEGWDLLNPYTILILHNDTSGAVKTYVKQMIGRGVRLFREKRIHGDLSGLLEEQQEILHVVTNRGSSFDQFIESIRKDMGLSSDTFKEETIKEEITNDIQTKFERAFGETIPVFELQRSLSIRQEDFFEELTYDGLQFPQWVAENTRLENGYRLFTFTDTEKATEIDLLQNERLNRGAQPNKLLVLTLNNDEVVKFVRKVVYSTPILPSSDLIKGKLIDSVKHLNSQKLAYYSNGPSREFIINRSLEKIRDHLDKIIHAKFENKLLEKHKSLSTIFPNNSVTVEYSPSNKSVPLNVKKWNELGIISNVKREALLNVEIMGFEKSWFRYNSFDSGQEFRLAITLDSLDSVDFWVRNKRQLSIPYGYHKYYPDFLVKAGGVFFLIEVKGSDKIQTPRTKKELTLINMINSVRSSNLEGIFFQDETVDKKLFGHAKSFADLINNSDTNRLLDLNGIGGRYR